jgi:hypothetical protein
LIEDLENNLIFYQIKVQFEPENTSFPGGAPTLKLLSAKLGFGGEV